MNSSNVHVNEAEVPSDEALKGVGSDYIIRDGAIIWTEPGLKGGFVTYSKPIKEVEDWKKYYKGE